MSSKGLRFDPAMWKNLKWSGKIYLGEGWVGIIKRSGDEGGMSCSIGFKT